MQQAHIHIAGDGNSGNRHVNLQKVQAHCAVTNHTFHMAPVTLDASDATATHPLGVVSAVATAYYSQPKPQVGSCKANLHCLCVLSLACLPPAMPPFAAPAMQIIITETHNIAQFTEYFVSAKVMRAHIKALEAYGCTTWQEAVQTAQQVRGSRVDVARVQ